MCEGPLKQFTLSSTTNWTVPRTVIGPGQWNFYRLQVDSTLGTAL
jgi:hypothetical protein